MYFIKYGDKYLHDPRVDEFILSDISLECEENSCGYCDFTIYPDHPLYGIIRERDADNPIKVYDNDILLFVGFIYELGKEFYLDGHVKCKGELDYLSETIVRPYSTLVKDYHTKAPDNLESYFNWLIEQHNSQVEVNKQFKIGINQADRFDIKKALEITNDSYSNTISEISEHIIGNNGFGGYLNLRYDNHGNRYIDYLYEWDGKNTQLLDFGSNLTSFTQTDDSTDIASYVLPTGAKLGDTNKYVSDTNQEWNNLPLLLTTKEPYEGSVNITSDIKIRDDIIYSKTAVKKYGWIGRVVSDTEARDKDKLVEFGVKALKETINPKRTIEVKAVDMHLINPNIKPIRIGEYVRIRSKPHGLDSYFLCKNIDLDLNNPENSIYTFGTTYDSFTGEQNKIINAFNSTIRKQFETIDTISISEKQTAATAEEIKSKFNELEVGGVNLYTGTRNFDGSKWNNLIYWETWDVPEQFDYREYGRSGSSIEKGIYQKVQVKKDHVYSFSFYARGDENASLTVRTKSPSMRVKDIEKMPVSSISTFRVFSIEMYEINECITEPEEIIIGNITDTYTRYHATFRALKDGYIYPRVENTTESWVQIYAIKFELGSIPTDWSPAPTDLESIVAKQDDAICALYEESLASQAETDDAICGLYEVITGGE